MEAKELAGLDGIHRSLLQYIVIRNCHLVNTKLFGLSVIIAAMSLLALIILLVNRNTSPTADTINGLIRTELNVGISAQVDITAVPPVGPAYTNTRFSSALGYYYFPPLFPAGTAYTITPTRDGNPLNGVTTYDLTLISQHILGIHPLGSPYKIIAADADKSNSVTALDILELRKLILGIYQNNLPNTPSWRFVDKSFVFPNSNNPFQTPFPEKRIVDSLIVGQSNDFVAIKVGDVNNTASPTQFTTADDRTTSNVWFENN